MEGAKRVVQKRRYLSIIQLSDTNIMLIVLILWIISQTLYDKCSRGCKVKGSVGKD